MVLCLCAGCSETTEATSESRRLPKAGVPQSKSAFSQTTLSPTKQAKRALRNNDLQMAQELVGRAVVVSPDDPETLRLAAEIAFASGDQDDGLQWMIEVARLDDFSDEPLLQDCVTRLLSKGRLFESIDFLEQAVEEQPNQSETRRNLVVFLVNAEQHLRARHHMRVLIRQRAFDKSTLFWLATQEQRDISPAMMNSFAKQNPDDRRLDVAKLRVLFDNGQWDQFETVSAQILSSSPRFLPAQLLLGQFLVQRRRFDQLAAWTASLSKKDAEEHWQYWEIVGDWATNRKDYPAAARAYFEASQRDRTVGSLFTKLARSLKSCITNSVPSDAITIASERGELINRFLQEKERYHKLRRRSCASIAEMANTLAQLGRLWEAEAWTAIGLSEPDQDVGAVKLARKRILGKLAVDTPWQLEAGLSIFAEDLERLPLPKLDTLAQSESQPDQVAEKIIPSAAPLLVDVAKQHGLSAAAEAPVTVAGGIIPLYAQLGHGGATVDFDHDGWPDLYIASCGEQPMSSEDGQGRLFRNVEGQFVDLADGCGIHERGFAQGVAAGDINEDGFTDLVLLHYGADQVFLNNGDGTYTERPNWFQYAENSWSTSGAIADIDLDGICDFICLKYCTAKDPISRRCTAPPTNAIEYCVPTDFDAEPDQFFRGGPEGKWTNANESWGIAPANPGRGLGVVVGQLDNAPGMDIYISNDMTSNHYWSAAEGKPFQVRDTATVRGIALDGRSRPQASMGIAVDDFDTDGDFDLFVTNFEAEHNTLYQQTQPGIWTDQSQVMGTVEGSMNRLGFGTTAVDFDNDSQLELVITNGHVHHNAATGYAQIPEVLRRSATGKYETIPADQLTQYFRERHVGRALWSLDFDRDHLLDLAVTHQGESPVLLHNQTDGANTNHWLRIKMVGTTSSRDAVGSVVSISLGDMRRTAMVTAGDGFFCSSEKTLHFGLGNLLERTEAQISVAWPDGNRQAYHAEIDQEILLIEGNDEVFISGDLQSP